MSDQLNAGTTSETTRTLKMIHIIYSHIHSNKTHMTRISDSTQLFHCDTYRQFNQDETVVQHYCFRSGVFNRLSSRANLHVSYNPAGRSHSRLQNHHGYIKHHHRGVEGSLGDIGEVSMT